MTTTTLTLTDFLLARIAEDAEKATSAVGRGILWHGIADSVAALDAQSGWHVLRWPPARVLAECEAKRQIMTMGANKCSADGDLDPVEFEREYGIRPADHYPTGYATGCDGCAAAETADRDHEHALRILALPYADHPDFREEWRP